MWQVGSPWGCDVETWYKEYDGVLALEAINASSGYNGYDRVLLFHGDYSACVDIMKNMSGKYNLYTNNCKDVSLYILSQAKLEYSWAFSKAAEHWMPTFAHDKLKEYYDIYHTPLYQYIYYNTPTCIILKITSKYNISISEAFMRMYLCLS